MYNCNIGVLTDQPILTAGLNYVLSANPCYRVFSCGRKISDVYKSLDQKPDILLIDIDMLDFRPSVISELNMLAPESYVIALTASNTLEHATKALEAGAMGCALKSVTADDLMQAIETVVGGGKYISPGFAGDLIAGMQRTVAGATPKHRVILSVREDQIVNMLLVGFTNKQIAAGLNISERTVKHYMTVLMQKLQARNRTEVVIAARNFALPRSDVDFTTAQGAQRH